MTDAFCFISGGKRYGLPISQVQEVFTFTEMTRVPHAPEMVAGIINYRGQAVPVIRLPGATESPTRKSVVVRTAQGLVGVLLNVMLDILPFDETGVPAKAETKNQVSDGEAGSFADNMILLDAEKLLAEVSKTGERTSHGKN